MKLKFFVLITLLYSQVFAGEVGTSNSSNNSLAKFVKGATAPDLQDCKPATTDPESAARRAAEAAGLSKEELLARLIYSESLSTGYWNNGCKAKSDTDIMTGIGWGIMNRVKSKATASLDAYSDVIFGKLQFSTSFSSKKKNPFAEAFLCPTKSDTYLNTARVPAKAAELYKKAQDTAKKIVSEYEANGIPANYKGITNFFYPESEYFGEMRPKWAPSKDPSQNKGYVNLLDAGNPPCVEFYRLK